jgi:DNA sulfur modification protein DndB
MGDTDFYQATMSARELVTCVHPASELDEWTTMSIEEQMQREPDLRRIRQDIAPYLAESTDRFFGAMIVLVYKGELHFESLNDLKPNIPFAYQSMVDNIGFLSIAGGSLSLIMLDGQHRLLALEQVINNQVNGKCSEKVAKDDVCVIFINHESNEKTRRIFNRVNRYAKLTSRSDNIITSEDDRSAIIARRLLSDGAPLGIKAKRSTDVIVEWKSHTLAARSKKLTTISVVYESVKLILTHHGVPLNPTSRPSEQELQQYYKWAEQFWLTVLNELQPYREAISNSNLIPEMRKDDKPYSLLFKSAGQIALFKGLFIAISGERLSLDEAVRHTNKIDWRMSSDIWKNVLVTPRGTLDRRQQGHDLAGKLIGYLIAADKMTQKEINSIQKEYNKAQGLKVIDGVEAMPLPKPVV